MHAAVRTRSSVENGNWLVAAGACSAERSQRPQIGLRGALRVAPAAMAAAAAAEEYEEEKKPHSYATYDDYLDDQVTEEDLYYLEVRKLSFRARCLAHNAPGS